MLSLLPYIIFNTIVRYTILPEMSKISHTNIAANQIQVHALLFVHAPYLIFRMINDILVYAVKNLSVIVPNSVSRFSHFLCKQKERAP